MAGFELLVRRLHPEALLPRRMSEASAGLDLSACLGGDRVALLPGQRALIPTGWAIAVPTGYEAQVRPRSGLALHHGVTVLNAPGTIDADYRGEVQVLLVNVGLQPLTIEHGDRIAQLVVAPVEMVRPREVEALPPAEGSDARGSGGFGSTGR